MYCKATLTLAVTVAFVLGLGEPRVKADPPTEWEVHYLIHEIPAYPQSRIVFRVILSLERTELDGNSIGWTVEEAEFRYYPDGIGPPPPTIWVQVEPALSSQDGLWWTTHADVNDPQMEEFDMPPLVPGTAQPVDPEEDELDYEMEFSGYIGTWPYDITTETTFDFTRESESGAISEGQDDPIEVVPEE